MRIRDIIIILAMIGVMSFMLIVTGLVLPTYTYTENGVTYTVDKEQQFATYSDEDYDVTFGFYINHKDLLFYREDEEDAWEIYDEMAFYYEMAEPEHRLSEVKPPHDGQKYTDQEHGEYYHVQSLKFVYLEDEQSYIGYFESDENAWYQYNEESDGWFLIME